MYVEGVVSELVAVVNVFGVSVEIGPLDGVAAGFAVELDGSSMVVISCT